MDKIIPNEQMEIIGGFDDEIDCAIMDDEDMISALAGIDSTAPDEDENDEVVDVNVDYYNDLHTPDIVDQDADDYIAAERDIMFDPFEDDDIMDAVDNDNEEFFDDEDDED